MSNNSNDSGGFVVGFIVGGLVGAAVALLLRPKPAKRRVRTCCARASSCASAARVHYMKRACARKNWLPKPLRGPSTPAKKL